jgi:hypothetical protein
MTHEATGVGDGLPGWEELMIYAVSRARSIRAAHESRNPRITTTALAVLLFAAEAFAAPGPVASIDSNGRQTVGAEAHGAVLTWELEQPANMGSGLSVPGDVDVVDEGGFDAAGSGEQPGAVEPEGHPGVRVGPPTGGEGGQYAQDEQDEQDERDAEMEARRAVPLGIDGPSAAQIDLETPSAAQMDLETPDARQQEVER